MAAHGMDSSEVMDREIEIVQLVLKAGRGNLTAQRALCAFGTEIGLEAEETGRDGFSAFYDAALFARMAAARGATRDRGNLLSLLSILARKYAVSGDVETASQIEGEALAVVESIANAGGKGCEDAATIIAGIGGIASPDAMIWAKRFKGVWG